MTGEETYEHPLVKALKIDPAQPPDLNPVQGFIGRSDDDTLTRVYRDAAMNVWIDIPTEQILHQEHQVAPNPLTDDGADVVWVTARNIRKLPVETSAAGAHPELVGQPLVGLRGAGGEASAPQVSGECPCCGARPPQAGLPPMGGGGGKWPAR
jgi:hypothetical protein